MSSMNMHIHRLLREQALVSRRRRLSFVLPTLESDRNLHPTCLFSNNNNNKIDWFKNLDRKKNVSWKSAEENWRKRHQKLPENMTNGAEGWKFLSRQFCKTTSLHGFNFFIDNENPLVERGCETIICSCRPVDEEEKASKIDEKQILNYRSSDAINSNYRGFHWENEKPLQIEFLTAELP